MEWAEINDQWVPLVSAMRTYLGHLITSECPYCGKAHTHARDVKIGFVQKTGCAIGYGEVLTCPRGKEKVTKERGYFLVERRVLG